MANTMTLIASSTVGSGGTATISFSSIPSTYTDLLFKCSVRTNAGVTVDNIFFTVNGSGTSYSGKMVYGNGASAVSSTSSSTQFDSLIQPGASSTTSTFGSTEIYIPNYTSSNYKSFSADSVSENNGTTAWAILSAGLWSNTSAITSVTITAPGSGSFIAASTAYLYGIKNS